MPIPVIEILTDYRGFFYSSTRNKDVSMRVDDLADGFRAHGYAVRVRGFADIDFRSDVYSNTVVLYQSAEDRGLRYKSYIEDVLLALRQRGAVLVPRFEFLRAHHNKVYMEFLRDASDLLVLHSIRSRAFGTYEEFSRALPSFRFPIVLKPAEGFKSTGVSLARNPREARRIARRISRSPHATDDAKNLVKRLTRAWHVSRSSHRRKFIVQDFVPDLSGDYKVLVYGDKVFALARTNRPHDFRASGSGLFQFREDVPRSVLTAAWDIYRYFDVPFISIDIAEAADALFVFEFQFVSFGNYTLERSPFWFEHSPTGWVVKHGRTDLETAVVDSVVLYVRTHLSNAAHAAESSST